MKLLNLFLAATFVFVVFSLLSPPVLAAEDLRGAFKTIVSNDPQVKTFGNLGGLVSAILQIVFTLSGILMFVYALIGIFQYITAGGNKEGLAKARARITWAIVGFLFIVIAFAISRYVQELIIPTLNTTGPGAIGH